MRICINLDDDTLCALDARGGSRSANICSDLKLFYASQAADKLMKGTKLSGTQLVTFISRMSTANKIKLVRVIDEMLDYD